MAPDAGRPRRSPNLVAIGVLVLAAVVLAFARGDGRPSERDDEVFLQAAWFMRNDRVSALEGVTRAVENQYGWTGEIAERFRKAGEIQTYALLPLWRYAPDLRQHPSPWGKALYVESRSLSWAGQLWFLASVFVMYWAMLPFGRGVALAAALLLALGHPFRFGPTLFDPWVMPAVIAAIGLFWRDRHLWAVVLAVAATMVKPNYLFVLPALGLAALVRPGDGDPATSHGWRQFAAYAGGGAFVVASYLALSAVGVIYAGAYFQGVRAGYDPGVLAYSLLEAVSYWFRAGTLQFRTRWPLYPWTVVNAGVLVWLGVQGVRRARLPRTVGLFAGLVLIPALANFAVIGSVHAYEWGGHFRWINVTIIGVVMVLPLGYREVARVLGDRITARRQPAVS